MALAKSSGFTFIVVRFRFNLRRFLDCSKITPRLASSKTPSGIPTPKPTVVGLGPSFGIRTAVAFTDEFVDIELAATRDLEGLVYGTLFTWSGC